METESPNSTVRDIGLLSLPSKNGRRQAKFPGLVSSSSHPELPLWKTSKSRHRTVLSTAESQGSVRSPSRSLPPPILSWSFQIVHFISSYSAALRRDSPEATGWLPGGSPSYCLCSFCLGADVFPGVRLWEARPLDRLGSSG